jgi:hypothetical protein
MAGLQQQVDDLQEVLDEVEGILQEVYRPETSREELAEAVGNALESITPGDEDEEDDDENALLPHAAGIPRARAVQREGAA